MRRLLGLACAVCTCLFFAAGCSKPQSDNKLSEADLKVFDAAPADQKQIWVSALEAAKTNNYVASENLLFMLIRQEISEAQKQVASKQINVVHQSLLAAVEKGDPAAQQALQELQQNPPNRPR